MCGVIVIDAGRSRSTNLGHDAYIHDHCLDIVIIIWGSINFPTVICLPTVCYLFTREATSETYGPRVFFLIYLLYDLFYLHFLFRSIKSKIQKYFSALYFIWHSIYQIITTLSHPFANFWHRCPKGIDNPFNTLGCEWLLFVCRGCLRCVDWFSYWFDNLGFISKRNTYRRCAASSLPLWGNTDVALSDIKRNFWRHCRGGSST